MRVDPTTVMLWLLGWGFLTAWIGERLGRRGRTWFWLGALLGPLATVALLTAGRREEDHAP